jgi:hypothetical protein
MDPASFLALQLRMSQAEAMINSRREELAFQERKLSAAHNDLRAHNQTQVANSQ